MTRERENLDLYLKPTFAIDSDSEVIKKKATLLTEKRNSQKEKAKKLFYFVRDEVKYNAYLALSSIEDYRASKTLQRREGFCIQKAVVLTALARAVGIPSRLGFADIRNHLAPKELVEMMMGRACLQQQDRGQSLSVIKPVSRAQWLKMYLLTLYC